MVWGDLEVTGRIKVKHDLIVLGDVRADTFSQDTAADPAQLIVTGSVTCGSGLLTEAIRLVSGRVYAPQITPTYNQVFAKIIDGVLACVLIEGDHGGSRNFGPVDTVSVMFDELRVDDEALSNASIEVLAAQLTPETWMVAEKETAALTSRLIEETSAKYDVRPGTLALHADRGTQMTSKTLAQLLADLDIGASHSRQQGSDDNPFSESQFNTMKYHSSFPGKFTNSVDAVTCGRKLFSWYNNEHHHGGVPDAERGARRTQ